MPPASDPPPGTRFRPPGEAGLAEVKKELDTALDLLRQHTRLTPIKGSGTHRAFGPVVVLLAALAGALAGGGGAWYAASLHAPGVTKAALSHTDMTPDPRRENPSVRTGLPDAALTPGETDAAPPGDHGPVPVETYRLVCMRYGADPGNPRYGVARLIPDWMQGTNGPLNLFASTRPLANLKILFDSKLKEMADRHEITREQAEQELRANWLEMLGSHSDRLLNTNPSSNHRGTETQR